MLSPNVFFLAVIGHHIAFPGAVGGKCMDLAELYLHDCYALPLVGRPAVEWPRLTLPGFTWVHATARNQPPPYALIVWHTVPHYQIGPQGHIGIAIDTDGLRFLSFDQDFPPGMCATYVEHTYKGVQGWHTPTLP